jgi:hypothetical protein
VHIATRRGPRGFATPFSAAILSDIKFVEVSSLLQRAAPATCPDLANPYPLFQMMFATYRSIVSPLMEVQWRFSGLPRSVRDVEQIVFGLGLDLAAIFQEDNTATAIGESDPMALPTRIKRVDAISSGLDQTLVALSGLRPAYGDPECLGKEYWGLESSVVVATALSLGLDASLGVHEMLDRLSRTPGAVQDSFSLAPFILARPPEQHELLGLRVIESVEYMTQSEMGQYGAQRAIFPLRILLNVLPQEYAAYGCAANLYTQLQSVRGLHILRDLSQVWGSSDD